MLFFLGQIQVALYRDNSGGCCKVYFIWILILDFQSDSDSFNPTLWEEQRQQRMTVAFEFEEKKEEEENAGKVKVTGIVLLAFCCFGLW